ncbi:spore germination protein [Xylanivirga thermophila]|jgi:spore germination protein KA|uniref:spore germination protein n=1 Tax=Xylanivirga thermophila TaxID=2496273 RepID=UPI00101C362D|nr:spore germination protein [Xylanivirga thermophila]
MFRDLINKLKLRDRENVDKNKEHVQLNSHNLKKILGGSEDVIFRCIYVGENVPVQLIFIDGLIDNSLISNFILKPLEEQMEFKRAKTEAEIIKGLDKGTVYYSSQKKQRDISEVLDDVLSGSIALVFDASHIAFTFEVKGFEKRSITEPSGENIIKGAKDAFVETLRVNTATIRRKIKSPNLRIEKITLGEQTSTSVGIIYIDNLTNRNMVSEVKKRLKNIEVDGVLTTAFVEEYIIDKKHTVFPQVLYTERPDKFCSNIIEGRIGLVIDGISLGLIVPAVFLQFLQAPEDYSQNFIISSIIRFLRFILVVVTLYLPGFYVAITSFHHDLIPTELAISIDFSKAGVPFPSFVEIIIMLIAFEVLVEAGLRLPQNIGQAVSIVGAVIVGQAAVSAKLVSPAVVIAVAVTAISSFAIPNQDFSNALRLWRFILVILSSIAGLFGLSMGGLILLYHLCTINILGVPYLSPFVATNGEREEDALFRFPISMQKNRPINLKTTNKKRRG